MNLTKTLLFSGLTFAMFAVCPQAAAQEEPQWESLGIGKYRDNIMHTYRLMGDWYPEWDVEIMESVTKPGHYKVVSAYKNSPFSGWGEANNDPEWCIFINAEDPEGVMIADWYAGFDFKDTEAEQVGPLMLWSQAHDYYENLYGDLERAKQEGLCGTLKNGAITFPPGAILVQIAPDYETHYTEGWKRTNNNGMWRVKLPGAPDLDVSLTHAFSSDGTTGTLTAFLDMDKDVQKVVAAVVKGHDAEAAYNAVVSGTIDTEEFTQSGSYTFSITENGQYTIMMVPYYNGEPLDPVFEMAEFIVVNDGWSACAEKATWSDGFLYGIEGDFFNWYPSTGQVEVQYSTTEPGVIRLVDPFSPESYEYSSNYDTTSKHYMVFRVDENKNVMIDLMSPTGLDIGYGPIDIWCKAGRWIELEKPENEVAEWYGKLDGNVITFPKGGLYIRFPQIVQSWYSSNHENTFRLELPDEALTGMSGITNAELSENAGDAVYYNLSGIRTEGDRLTPGIYIKVADGKSSKIMVK